MMTASETPKSFGYRWPAEWERHACTWVAWPHNQETWPGRYPAAVSQFVSFVETIARYEPVHVLAGGKDVFLSARYRLGHLPNVTLHDIPTNDAWTRDHGPIFLSSDSTELGSSLVDWEYNAWGGKYPPYDSDNAVARRIAEATGCCRFRPGLVLEGGSIEGNGNGLLLTTTNCLLNRNRNPGLNQNQIETALREYLSAEHVLWLRGEIPGDDTDGHVDQLVRFVNTTTVVVSLDVEGSESRENLRKLEGWTGPKGQRLSIVHLPVPGARFHDQKRLPASYANFYIVNGAVLVPGFDDPNDELARRILADCFPGREVITLSASDLIVGLGAFHCLTQQQPNFR